jgi:hypothetical protein
MAYYQVRNSASVSQQPAPQACFFSGRSVSKVLANREGLKKAETIREQVPMLFTAKRFLDSKRRFISPSLYLPKSKRQPLPSDSTTYFTSSPDPASLTHRFHQLQKYCLLVAPLFSLIQPGIASQSSLPLPRPPYFVFTVSALNSAVSEIPLSISGRLLACLSNLSWLIVPDTGMLKKHNEWLFHSDSPAQPGLDPTMGQKSRAAVDVRTSTPILPLTTEIGPTADKCLITSPLL